MEHPQNLLGGFLFSTKTFSTQIFKIVKINTLLTYRPNSMPEF